MGAPPRASARRPAAGPRRERSLSAASAGRARLSKLRGVATGDGGRSGFVQNFGDPEEAPAPPCPPEAFSGRLGDAVGRRERRGRGLRAAGVRRAVVYPGAA